MKIKIYQVNLERDRERVAFMDYAALARHQGVQTIRSEIYDQVFEGDVECETLEAVFYKFNLDHPENYRGRSLSVSDIVEVTEAETVKSGFYYCDDVGFNEVSFSPEQAQSLKEPDTIRVLLLEPGKNARIADIEAGLEGLQKVVGGYIEACYPFEEEVCIICNEEGKIRGLPLNRMLYTPEEKTEMSYADLKQAFREAESRNEHRTGYIVFTEDSFAKPYSPEARTYKVSSDNKAFRAGMAGYSIFGYSTDGSDRHVRLDEYMADERGEKDGWKIESCFLVEREREPMDILCGTAFICGCGGENFSSLTDSQLEKFKNQFEYPEQFFRRNGEICSLPIRNASDERER